MKKLAYTILAGFLTIAAFDANAQATQATNAISSGSFLGTSNANDVVFKRDNHAAGLLSTTRTYFGVSSLAMASSASFGNGAGHFASGSGFCTYIGQDAGRGQSTTTTNSGIYNSFFGYNSGINNVGGNYNTFLGNNSGTSNIAGTNNISIGAGSGSQNADGDENVFIGSRGSEGDGNVHVGYESASGDNGSYNTYLGYRTGDNIIAGNGNVLIGSNAKPTGDDISLSNKLLIDNSQTDTPLIWGDFSADQVKLNGKVGIGDVGSFPATAGSVNVSGYNLFVTGGILADEVRIYASEDGTWADYVFAKDYKLPTLAEVENHIREKGHLMNVPSADEVCENGIELGEMAKIQQEKIEELTLYVIEQNKINEKQAEAIDANQKDIAELKALVTQMLEK